MARLFVLALLVALATAETVSKDHLEREKDTEKAENIKKPEIHEKMLHGEVNLFDKQIEYYLKSPVAKMDRECLAKLKTGLSIDFVIDIAPSPTLDQLDKLSSDSPVALFLDRIYRQPTRAYFESIQYFIDAVTLDLKPELSHSVIYDRNVKSKFFIKGRAVDDVEAIDKMWQSGVFEDKTRNLKTLWPTCTREVVGTRYNVVNNLGRMTKLALFNRDNGLPTVLAASRRSKPIFSVVITDGWSGAKIEELVDDLHKTIVIDVGNHRFVDRVEWNEMRKIASTFTLSAPQQLPFMFDTVRNLACRWIENEKSSL